MYWSVDASFAVHNDMKSHTGGRMTLGNGALIAMSTKQKLNTTSSAEAELVGVSDSLPFNLRAAYFIMAQGNCRSARLYLSVLRCDPLFCSFRYRPEHF